jgi:ribonucleotide reductase alpha subunit
MIASQIADGRLAVVNIYIDEDIQAWRSYMPIYPEEWYNGFDPDYVIRNSDLYNVRAIPSLYLLDAEKRVIMKDAPEERLFRYLSSY